jgi:hypothetical protein
MKIKHFIFREMNKNDHFLTHSKPPNMQLSATQLKSQSRRALFNNFQRKHAFQLQKKGHPLNKNKLEQQLLEARKSPEKQQHDVAMAIEVNC